MPVSRRPRGGFAAAGRRLAEARAARLAGYCRQNGTSITMTGSAVLPEMLEWREIRFARARRRLQLS